MLAATPVLLVYMLCAYAMCCMCPQVKHLKEQETKGASTRPKRPRALVLGPTRELTDQILTVAKGLSHYAKFRSTCLNGGKPHDASAAPYVRLSEGFVFESVWWAHLQCHTWAVAS